MKKNMLSILILALLIVNIVLTSVMMFSVVGASKKTSALIDDIASAINLDLENQAAVSDEPVIPDVPIDKTALHAISEEMTIPLAKSPDGMEHYYLLAVSLSMNMDHKDYRSLSASVAEKEDLIKGEIINVVKSHTIEEVREDTDSIRMEILDRIQKLFDSDFIFNVTFTKNLTQ